MVGTGRMHRLIPVAALALAGGTQDRCRGKSLVMAPTTQRTIVVGRVTAPAGAAADPVVAPSCHVDEKAGAGRSGSHGPAAPIASNGPGRPPL